MKVDVRDAGVSVQDRICTPLVPMVNCFRDSSGQTIIHLSHEAAKRLPKFAVRMSGEIDTTFTNDSDDCFAVDLNLKGKNTSPYPKRIADAGYTKQEKSCRHVSPNFKLI